ncbi:hypothetical protein [Asticcacaulis solisilvae]|uniref:hypothetical protein n=1 Tax=Asticcacaulis solisilvae TaxID=1217274 RepID=UPI003FD873CF
MQHKRTLMLVMGGHLVLLLLIYLPYVFKHMESLEIIVPGLLNILLIGVSFVASLIVSIVPSWQKYCGWWWLSFGALMLASLPACLATAQLNEMIVR